MKKIFLILLIAVSLGFTINQEFDFVQNYTRNFASDYTARSFTDKGYVDSAITANKPALSKSWSIPPTTSSDNYTLFYTPVAITITDVVDVFQGTTPSYSYNIRFASDRSAVGTAVFASDRTATSLTGSDTQTFANDGIPADSYVWLDASATGGTVNEFFLTIIFTED